MCQTAFSPEENRFHKQYTLKRLTVRTPWFTRKTAQALKDLYGIEISHQQVANYCKTAALVVKPFLDNYNSPKSSVFTADETYIKVRGI